MKVKDFLKKHKAQIYLAILAAYAAILVMGAVNEVFNLGWFRWLGPW